MKRRDFISLLGGAAVVAPIHWPHAGHAQQPAVPVIGILSGSAPRATELAAFRQSLKASGYIEGQNAAIEYRSAHGQDDRMPALAAELVRHPVNVFVANSTAAAFAAMAATASIPIVFRTGADPVQLGLVASLNRPGGNITGVSFLVNELIAKRLELLVELVPPGTTIAMLADPNNRTEDTSTKDAQAAAKARGRNMLVVTGSNGSEIDTAFATMVQQRAGALFVAPHGNLNNWRDQIVALAARSGIPANYPNRDYVEAGGLMSYGPSQNEVYGLVATYATRILKGEKPADLPVVLPTKFEFVLNLKTAKALGLTISSGLLSIVDEVLE